MWVRIEDGFPSHPKALRAGPAAVALWLSSLCWCCRYLTDGEIPAAAAPALPFWSEQAAAALVRVGLWDETPEGWRVHDYLRFQPSAEQERQRRATTAARVTRYRQRHGGVSNGVTSGSGSGSDLGSGSKALRSDQKSSKEAPDPDRAGSSPRSPAPGDRARAAPSVGCGEEDCDGNTHRIVNPATGKAIRVQCTSYPQKKNPHVDKSGKGGR